MPELMFVLKSFAIAIAVAVCLQVRVGTTTLENQAHAWIQTASVPGDLKDVSSGAILAVKNATKVSTDFVSKTFGHDSLTQRAGRLSFDFKRSSQSSKDSHEDTSESAH